jgi:ABC-2 type transport system ATP-binding protein
MQRRRILQEKAIVVRDLVKVYPRVTAVDGVSFSVDKGEIFGLLGPNGAGKTTTIRILLTLIKPTAGKTLIYNIDTVKHSQEVRSMCGYVPQDVSADGDLTAYENVLIYSKLYGMSGKERKTRIREVLDFLELSDRANDIVQNFSGGMMRRLEIAQALVNRPRVLFLDEPSIGLDPNARRIIWSLIKKLREEFGTTIFMTTHDMNEADVLCDRIGIMNLGHLATLGKPLELKSDVGGDIITIISSNKNCYLKLKELGFSNITNATEGQCDLVVNNGETLIPKLLDSLKQTGVQVESVALKKPTLDDVFLKYTGARIEEGDTFAQTRRTRRTFTRLTK